MSSHPRVSVLMPAYDAAPYLPAAIESLLGQSFGDFELIVIDDGSTDATPEILAGIDDPRLIVLRQPDNRGYVPALNRALEEARGEYVARQDADDVSLPGRLAAQVEALDRDLGLVLVGTGYRTVDVTGDPLASHQPPTGDAAIRWQMLFHNAFVHSSVMFRRRALDRAGLRYDASYVPAEDYRLWSQLLEEGRGANLPQPLAGHRKHAEQISERQADRQRRNADLVSRGNLERLGVRVSDDELRVLRGWTYGAPGPLGRGEIAHYARSAEILTAFRRRHPAAAELAAIGRSWARQTLTHLPTRRLADAWRAGLLSALLRRAPGTTLAHLARRIPRRLLGDSKRRGPTAA